ncbi:MAG: hypothetical protein MOGDAGHF_00621 [Rhodocyclaceae bacterium]|nr:hypothetical protein [Rhodocyclaceae bacterium]
MNQAATALQIGIAHITVLVQRRFLDNLVGLEQLGAVADDTGGEQQIAGLNVIHVGNRVGGNVKDQADGIPHVARTEERQDNIRTIVDAPAAEGLADVLFMLFHAHGTGDIDDAEESDGGIHQDAAGIRSSLCRLALQQVVHPDHQVGNVRKEVGDAGLDRRGQHGLVAGCDGLDDDLVETFVEAEHGAVEALDRILRIPARGASTQQAGDCQRNCQIADLPCNFCFHRIASLLSVIY